jgi:hypothetical protein
MYELKKRLETACSILLIEYTHVAQNPKFH